MNMSKKDKQLTLEECIEIWENENPYEVLEKAQTGEMTTEEFIAWLLHELDD